MACGDPYWYIRQENQLTDPLRNIFPNIEGPIPDPLIVWKEQMETRPAWGKYWPNDYPDNDLEFYDRPIYCWLPACVPFETPAEEVQELTAWLIENIDNVWEGPIGYLGFWKFRFTEESDVMVFKLLK